MDHGEEPPARDELELKQREWKSAFDQAREANAVHARAFEAYMRLEDGAEEAFKKSTKDLRSTGKKLKAADKELLRAIQRNDDSDREGGE